MQNEGLIKFAEWRLKAEEDFLSANVLLKNNGAPATIAFLSQQMVEKYLKGFMVLHNKSFEKTHQLDDLLRSCMALDNDFASFIDEVSFLNGYYIESRYPLNIKEDIFMEEAREALEAASKIRNFVLAKVEI